ncbi:MAG: hypothetical protein JSS49_19030 [Planctomycetes bacterium]|nr:hypothetical protein [Planctomycetota bacterium]
MSGQTIIQYGDVTLLRCLTRRVEQQPVLDPTGTDLKYWRYQIQVTGYLHGWPAACQYHSITGHTPTDANAPLVHQQVRWRLLPRQSFVMAMGCTADIASGQTLLRVDPWTAATPAELTGTGLTGIDVDDGPRCTQFDVVHISADNIFQVEATFELHQVQCDDDNSAAGNTDGVLLHRWSCTDGLNVNLRATRVYSGFLELATSNFSPHWFRSLVIPPLQPGMRREQMQFTASEDGRCLQYTVTDQEIAIAAPYPARRWSVEHTEHSLNDSPLQSHSQILVTLEGDGNVDKGQLILLALYVVTAKLAGGRPGVAPPVGSPVVMRDLTITDFTGDTNAIRVSAACERLGQSIRDDSAGATDLGLRICTDGFERVIAESDLPAWSVNYDPRRSSDGRLGETPVYQGPVSLTGILRCYLQSPCTSDHGINLQSNLLGTDLNSEPSATPQASIQAVIVPSIPSVDPPYYSVSHRVAMYTTYQMESIYRTRRLRAALPIASVPYLGSGTDTSDACAIISLGRPQTRRIVRIAAERVGEWPEFPDPETMDAGAATTADPGVGLPAISQRLLSSKLLGGTQTRTCNGEVVFRARFEAVFALLRTPTAAEILKFGQNKWSTDSGTQSNSVLTNSSY